MSIFFYEKKKRGAKRKFEELNVNGGVHHQNCSLLFNIVDINLAADLPPKYLLLYNIVDITFFTTYIQSSHNYI